MSERYAELREAHIHDWESGTWGVIVGVSRCRECGEVAQSSDFPDPDAWIDEEVRAHRREKAPRIREES